MVRAEFFQKLGEEKVQCNACEWHCRIDNGKTGVCGVRKNIMGELKLLVYGRSVSAHVDPIEKKPLYHFLPGADIFSIGTLGCNFACGFCQNWSISQASKNLAEKKDARFEGISVSNLGDYGYALSPKKIVQYCLDNKIGAIAYTYNEPTIFAEYAFDTAKKAREHDIRNVFVTNGYMSEELIPHMAELIDAANIDLKSFRDDFYKKICKARLEPVLRNIAQFHKEGVWLELTTLIVPGENDSENELEDIAEFIASVSKDIPWHISRFHPDFEMEDKPITPGALLDKAYEIGKAAGLKYIYIGNVRDSSKSNTTCPACGNELVTRRFMNTQSKVNLEKGQCPECGESIAGVWS